MEHNFLVGPLKKIPVSKVVLFFQMNRSIQKNNFYLQFSLALTSSQALLYPTAAILNWKLAKHLLAQIDRPIPFGIFRSDFPFRFLHSFYMLPNQMGFYH